VEYKLLLSVVKLEPARGDRFHWTAKAYLLPAEITAKTRKKQPTGCLVEKQH